MTTSLWDPNDGRYFSPPLYATLTRSPLPFSIALYSRQSRFLRISTDFGPDGFGSLRGPEER